MIRLKPLWNRIEHRWLWLLLIGISLAGGIGVILAASTPSAPQALFLGWDEAGATQLFQADVAGGPPAPLTAVSPQSGRAITEYTLSPDEQWIAYLTQPDPETPGGESIWIMNRKRGGGRIVHTCGDAHCRGLVWHPDNRRLVFAQRPLEEDGTPGAPRLRWLDTISGETAPLFGAEEETGMGARFSPTGDWIGYVTSDQEGVQLYNFVDGRHFLIRSLTGAPPTWHPSRPLLLVSDFNRLEVDSSETTETERESHQEHNDIAVHLYQVDVTTGERRLLSQPLLVEDGAPAWSPDGAQIAFGRRPPRTATGRQLWVMGADGSDARPLTHEPLVNYGPPSWSEDGRFLLCQRFDLSDPDADPAIWLVDVATGEGRQVAANGIFPTWVHNR